MSQATGDGTPQRQFEVRAAKAGDAETIAKFNAAMARETEHLELEPERLLAGVRAMLSDASKGFYLVACAGGEAVGQLMITYEWSDWRNGNFWWIQSVYVRPDWRGEGVFKRLYREVERQARELGGSCGLRLYVEGDNTRAQQVYTRLGMKTTPYKVYESDFVLRR